MFNHINKKLKRKRLLVKTANSTRLVQNTWREIEISTLPLHNFWRRIRTKKMKVSKNTIVNWENGKIEMKPAQFKMYSEKKNCGKR